MRPIDADALLKGKNDHEMISTHLIFNAPTLDVKPVIKGRWIWELEDWNKWTCSECGYSKRTDVHIKLGYNFCPYCGADMRESEDEK